MEKYNRSKMAKSFLAQGLSVEETVAKCMELGDKNESCLIYATKRIKRELSKVTAPQAETVLA